MNKEEQILQHIRMNPYISQQELAKKVDLSRSAVANYITSLTRKGEIKGRAYILKEESSVMCIGGANIDREARSEITLRLHSSNPVKIKEVCGGVARNFAEHLSQLGMNTSLLTSVGNDREGKWLLEETKNQGVDISQVWTFETERTGTYTALIDNEDEMLISMADMEIYDKLNLKMVEEKWSYISASQAVFLDTNFPENCIQFVINRCKEESIPLYIHPVSSAKAEKLPGSLHGVELLILHHDETESLAESLGNSKEALYETFMNRGVKNILMLLPDEQLYYASQEGNGHLPTDIPHDTKTDDAFAACIIFGMLNGETLEFACQQALKRYSLLKH